MEMAMAVLCILALVGVIACFGTVFVFVCLVVLEFLWGIEDGSDEGEDGELT